MVPVPPVGIPAAPLELPAAPPVTPEPLAPPVADGSGSSPEQATTAGRAISEERVTSFMKR
jgi:hypothetical protein